MSMKREIAELRDLLSDITKQLELSQPTSEDFSQLKRDKGELLIRLRELEEIDRLEQATLGKEVARMKELCELGSRFQKRTFDTFEVDDRYREQYISCKEFAEMFPVADGKGLYLYGNVGTGKTHLVAAIANYIIEEKHRQAVFVNHITLLNRIKQSFDTGEDITSWYKKAPLLIIDDIGKSKVTDWVREVIYDIVNYRYENELSSVFTSNYDLETLANMIGLATVSRISEACQVHQFGGNDRRRSING